MNIFDKIADALSDGYHHVLTWFAPETKAASALLAELKAEIDRIGPQIIYDAASLGLQAVLTGGGTTATVLTAAADVAIAKLKDEGKTQVTLATYGAIAAALLKMNAQASSQGIQTQPQA